MRRGHLDGLKRFRVEPITSVTKAVSADRTNLPVDDRKFEFAIERSRLDVAPSRCIEKPDKRFRKFFHDQFPGGYFCPRRLVRLDLSQRSSNPYFYESLRFST